MTCENDMDRDSNKKHFISFFFPGIFYARMDWVWGDCLFLSRKMLFNDKSQNE